MKVSKYILALLSAAVLCVTTADAANLTISLGIRETATTGPIFSNGGAGGSIEWVNLDGQVLTADGTWQTFTFTPSTDTLSGFTGDGVLDGEWATIEHIRIRNTDGITDPIILYVDDVTNTVAAGPTTENFDGFSVGDEVMFQEPGFSGSTSGNILAGSTAGVTDDMALSGNQSYRADFQFIDNDSSRWLRFTTFGAANLPNPAIRTVEPGAAAPTVSFALKAVVIPEPATMGLMLMASVAMVATRRR